MRRAVLQGLASQSFEIASSRSAIRLVTQGSGIEPGYVVAGTRWLASTFGQRRGRETGSYNQNQSKLSANHTNLRKLWSWAVGCATAFTFPRHDSPVSLTFQVRALYVWFSCH